MLKHAIAVVALVVSAGALAQPTPVGLWKTIDDDTKKEKSLVRISDTGGVLNGKIEKLLEPAAGRPDPVCDECTDDRKGKPLVGLTIVRNAKRDAQDHTLWTGGDITDPNNGKVYRLRMKPAENGKTLEVRGYIGPFYRNQTWVRVE